MTVADALRSPVAGDIALEVLGRHLDDLVLVTEDEIREGMRFLYSRAKLACEGGGAVGVAALLAGKIDVRGRTGVACVISGGNVSPEIAAEVLGTPRRRGGRARKPQSSSRWATVNSSPSACSTIAISVRPLRVAAAARHEPARSVYPVFSPRAPA